MPDSHDFPTAWLRVFVEVARTGSFTAAAAALDYTQSAVSRQIAALEAEFGTPLFDRLPRGVRPTESGRLLLRHAEATLAQLDRARVELAALGRLESGRLRVGCFATAAASLVPQVLGAFRAAHPGVVVTLESSLTADLLRRLAEDVLDLAVVAGDPVATRAAADARGVLLEPLLDERMLVALPPGHRLAGRRDLRLAELADESWIAGSERPGDTLLGSALGSGFRPHVGYVVGDWIAKQGLVAAGFGITLVPALAAAALRPDLARATVHPDDVPVRTVWAATPRGVTPGAAAAAFLPLLRAGAEAFPRGPAGPAVSGPA
ncbi:DNA-binding transcriptional LysR family regulator [Streptacidiphilus sp. MAP12-33]|uniref:LysR family transcriptional regulator n=1 Tax=Streptacidiphilus sp. MAP12-33 TaxID=3156266 RepID=UPI003515D60E